MKFSRDQKDYVKELFKSAIVEGLCLKNLKDYTKIDCTVNGGESFTKIKATVLIDAPDIIWVNDRGTYGQGNI